MKQFIADAVTVFVENGTTFILSPNGDRLDKLTGVTLVDNHLEIPTVTITLHCNVVGSELEANQKYKAAKLQAELESQKKEIEYKALQATRKFKDGERVKYWEAENEDGVIQEGTIMKATFSGNTGSWDYKIQPDNPVKNVQFRYEMYIKPA